MYFVALSVGGHVAVPVMPLATLASMVEEPRGQTTGRRPSVLIVFMRDLSFYLFIVLFTLIPLLNSPACLTPIPSSFGLQFSIYFEYYFFQGNLISTQQVATH